jgi:hypothetical protein
VFQEGEIGVVKEEKNCASKWLWNVFWCTILFVVWRKLKASEMKECPGLDLGSLNFFLSIMGR